MAKDLLKKPVQETGDDNQPVKDFSQGWSGWRTTEQSTTTESPEIEDGKGETEPAEEHGRLPEERAAPSGIGDGNCPIMKVSVETQTEEPEQSPDRKPEPEGEDESGIKEMSTQTPSEANGQLSPGRDVKGKKKKTRPRKRRPSKERKEAKTIPSCGGSQIRSSLLKSSVISGKMYRVFLCLILSTLIIPCSGVEEGKEWHVYRFVAKVPLIGENLTIKFGTHVLCEIPVNTYRELVACNNSFVSLINNNTLLLVTKKNESYFLEANNQDSPKAEYEGSFPDPQSALKNFVPKGDQDPHTGATEGPQYQQITDGMSPMKIVLIVLGIFAVIVVIASPLLYKYKDRLCKRNVQPPAETTELANLNNPGESNAAERHV